MLQLKLEIFRPQKKNITKNIPIPSYDVVKIQHAMETLGEALDSESTYSAMMLAFQQFKSKAYEISLIEQSYGSSELIHIRMHEHRTNLNVLICAYMNLAKMYYEKFYWIQYKKTQPPVKTSMISSILKSHIHIDETEQFQLKVKKENPALELGLKLRNFMQHNVLLSHTIRTSFNNHSGNIFVNMNTAIHHDSVRGKSAINDELLKNFTDPIDVNNLIDQITECISKLHRYVREKTESNINQEHTHLINLNNIIAAEVELIEKKYSNAMIKETLEIEHNQQEVQYDIGWFAPYEHSKEKYCFYLPHSKVEYARAKKN